MKPFALFALCLFLVGCGPSETLTSAATAAKMKEDEIKAGQQLEAQTRAKIDQAMQAGQANLQAADQKETGE